MDLQREAGRRYRLPFVDPIGALRRSLDHLLPPVSLDGRQPVLSQGMSAEGWSRIAFLDAPVCDGCGAPFDHDHGLGARCAGCMSHPRLFDRARAACVYDEASRDLVLRFKHGDRPELGRLFATWLSRAGADLLRDADMVVPVPLHPRRLFARRYNQAAEIARPLARLAGVRYQPDILVRERSTASQGGRSALGRQRNVQGAFAVHDRSKVLIDRRRIVLIDDVFTTGATVESCAGALMRAGALAVDVLAVARVRDAVDLTI